MVRSGDITAEQAATADSGKLKLSPGTTPNDCTAATTSTGYFCDYFRIITSLDPKVQATAQTQVMTVYGYANKRVAPMAVVQPGTGKVLALAVKRHYGTSSKPGYDMNQLIAGGGGLYGYQAGSTFGVRLAATLKGQPEEKFTAPSLDMAFGTGDSASRQRGDGPQWTQRSDSRKKTKEPGQTPAPQPSRRRL